MRVDLSCLGLVGEGGGAGASKEGLDEEKEGLVGDSRAVGTGGIASTRVGLAEGEDAVVVREVRLFLGLGFRALSRVGCEKRSERRNGRQFTSEEMKGQERKRRRETYMEQSSARTDR